MFFHSHDHARCILVILMFLGGSSAAVGQASESTDALSRELTSILTSQSHAWNRGDIDAFMTAYWNSDKLSFSSGGKTTRGWTATRDGYKKRYPTKERMGQLTFSNLEISRLGAKAALVLGNWRLRRTSDSPGGNFSLVFRKLQGAWLIVHDHTSLLEKKSD